jgi:hypothetical protein
VILRVIVNEVGNIIILTSLDKKEEHQFVSQMNARRCAENIKRAGERFRMLGLDSPPQPPVPNKLITPVPKKIAKASIVQQRKSKRVIVHDPTANQDAEQRDHEGGDIPQEETERDHS